MNDNTRVSVTFRIPKQMYNKMNAYLECSGMTKQSFLESVLGGYLTTYFIAMREEYGAALSDDKGVM